MDTNIFFAVIFASFLHATWNAMVKIHKDKNVAVAAIILGHIPAALVVILFSPIPSIESIPYILISAFVHQGYQWFLITAYRHGDYTKVYPIARGTGPLIVTIVSVIFFGVVLNKYELFGIMIVCIGILSLSFQYHKFSRNTKAISSALLTGLFIGTYSMVDGYGARLSLSPLSFIGWSFILNGLIFPFFLKLMNQPNITKKIFKEAKGLFLIGGTISYIVYAIVVWAFTKAPIPLVSTLREASIIISLLIGTLFLKERFTILKSVSILVIFIGVVLLGFF